MEQNELNSLLREADRIDRPLPIDTLVDGGIRRGRRRLRNRRLSAVGALGTTLAALGAVVAFGLPPGGTGVTIAPAAVPTSKPSPSESSKPPADKLPSVAELTKIIKGHVPDDLTMRKVTPTEALVSNTTIVFELGDDDGYSWAGGGVFRTDWFGKTPCNAAQGCTESKVEGGVVRIHRDKEKVGDGTWYYFKRSDGTEVWFGQRNAFQGNGPVTRDRLPLTDKEVIALITDADWEKLTDRLPEKQPIEPEEKRLVEEKLRQTEASGKPKR